MLCKIWIFFLKKEECRIIISYTLFYHGGINIIKNITWFNLVSMYRYHKLMIQIRRIFRGNLMEFIYALRLNFQGGYNIMDLQKVQFITIPNVLDIPITDVVINSVEKWRRINYLIHFKVIIWKRKKLFPRCWFGRSGPPTTNWHIEEK